VIYFSRWVWVVRWKCGQGVLAQATETAAVS